MSDGVTGSPVVRVRDRDVQAEWCRIDKPMGSRYSYHLSLADIAAIQREAAAECPRCHHPHLDYADDEDCVSCGCGLYDQQDRERIQREAVDRDRAELPRLLAAAVHLAGSHGGSVHRGDEVEAEALIAKIEELRGD